MLGDRREPSDVRTYHRCNLTLLKGVVGRPVSKVIVLGAGVCGRAAGMLLRRDAHEVTILPLGAAAHALDTLAEDGTSTIVEPFAYDPVHDNLNAVGRVFDAGQAQLAEVIRRRGFAHVRRATGTPLNLVLDARP